MGRRADQLDVSAVVEHEVLRLEVAVDDTLGRDDSSRVRVRVAL